MQIKQVTGNITQITTPIVDPIKPRTSSILGMSIPIAKDTKTITTVNNWNLFSGI